MLRSALFNIIRQEQREIEDRLVEEERNPAPDIGKLVALRQQAMNLRRELDHFPDV
ncbi:MAG TPA: hypothetical protein VD978_19255 [Azospirillum sp.]|nr:hypothetical protein [Azospirillum sp.]